MNITRYWTDPGGIPHSEITQWQIAPDGVVGEVAPWVGAVGPTYIEEPIDAGVPVILVAIAGAAVVLDRYAGVRGYLAMELPPGAAVIDLVTFDGLVTAAIDNIVDVDQQLVEYLAAQVPAEVGTMIDKVAAAAGLTPGEKAVFGSRFG